MTSIIPFLTAPFSYAMQAYKEAKFELPLSQDDCRIYKSNPQYDQAVKSLRGYQIKEDIQPFLDKIKIRKDLIVVESINAGFCAAKGGNMTSNSDAAILLAPGLHAVDREACHWLLKHEISHIRNNDLITMPLAGSICSTAAAVWGTLSMTWVPTTLLTYSVGLSAFLLSSQWRERKADDFAIENSSNEELLGGRRFLLAAQNANLEERDTFWKKIAISLSGDDRFDILHPSLTSRIQKIEKVLEKRKVSINSEQENSKIENLKILIVNHNRLLAMKIRMAGGAWGLFKEMNKLKSS